MTRLDDAYHNKALVIFAGAGVSAAAPTSLPGWKPLNAAIFRALRARLEIGLGTEGWLAQMESFVDSQRNDDRFPPDYQAQIIEEMCGERYFRALQSVDVDVTNSGHEGIAQLTAAGAVRAIVTTNFDRLIEQALDRHGVAYETAFEETGFINLRDRLATNTDGPIPLIKIHGCVSDHLSMIDTLKQRRKGRSKAIEQCLEAFYPGYWIYLGFSAADLETESNYLGLVKGAAQSRGATYIAYPKHPDLGPGARLLTAAYGGACEVVVANVDSYLAQINARNGVLSARGSLPLKSGFDQFEHKLEEWVSGLSLAATGLCLASILEAAGQSEFAARVLDKLARKEIYDERETTDFKLLQLHYGRLGAAFGRFIHVPDQNGFMSNASVEAVQSLARLRETEYASAAMAWMPCLYLWLNDGVTAMAFAGEIVRGFVSNEWGLLEPRSDEEGVDAWLALAQVCIINTHPETIRVVKGTFEMALRRAKRSGDVVRTSRVVALFLLAMAETYQDVPALAVKYGAEIDDMHRVGDGFTSAFLALALARWHTGPGGMALARETKNLAPIAQQALKQLEDAYLHLENQGMDPWVLFADVQAAKALSDLRDFEAVNQVFQRATSGLLDRFPIFISYIQEAAGQIKLQAGDPQAAEHLGSAIKAADESGLYLRRDLLRKNYGEYIP